MSGQESPKLGDGPDANPKGKCCRTGCHDCPWGYTESGIDPEYPAELQQIDEDEDGWE